MLTVYGIPNCDTVKKARMWLHASGIEYRFHDYKKSGVEAANLSRWIEAAGLDRILNRSGATFRKLPPGDRGTLDTEKAMALMVANPSMIRRPIVEDDGLLLVGFDPGIWADAFG